MKMKSNISRHAVAVLGCLSLISCASVPVKGQDDVVTIKKEFANLQYGYDPITNITVTMLDPKELKQCFVITNQSAISDIRYRLARSISEEKFTIGMQVHSPFIGLKIELFYETKEHIQLKYVGLGMFWLSWTNEMRKHGKSINFRSEEFERYFFRIAFLELMKLQHSNNRHPISGSSIKIPEKD